MAIKRIKAFLLLPEVDKSYISYDNGFKNAIEVTGGASFSYGTEEDAKVQPELDPQYYIKREIIASMKKHIPKL